MNGLDLLMIAGWLYVGWAAHYHLVAYRDRT